VVVGAGVVPNAGFLPADAPLTRARDGSVVVDAFLHAGHDVFVAGDVATFPFWLTGDTLRVEHWNNAIDMGAAPCLPLRVC
jgi:NADPH-dependent 2,4-dienoyl-CoA reductase/sulfur reductase-like enzyme